MLTKLCYNCKEILSVEMFYEKKGGKYGVDACCIPCRKIIDKEYNSRPDVHARKAEQGKFRRARIKYGLSEEEYLNLLHNTLACAICNNLFVNDSDKEFDHSHASGKFRDILCQQCNLLLGYAEDNKETLLRAISYLNNHNSLVSSSNGTSDD
jgi:hypothetical protein